MISTSSGNPVKRSRRPSARVKTGCITCKARRVKCDENRPNCLKCTSIGRKCEGYQPKQGYEVQVFQASTSSIRTVSNWSEFGSNVDCLEFYYHCAGPSLSDEFDNEFWRRITLQMAHSEPAVRHALITIAYLNRQQTGSLKHAARSNLVDSHETRSLLLHYNKSLRLLVDRMMQPSYSAEVGLVTCLLFVCIEFLRADHHTAFTHLRNGLKIIADMQQQRHREGSPRHITWSKSECSDASREMIETRIIPMFVRGMASALMHGVNVEEDFEVDDPQPHSYPKSFATFREAQSSSHKLWNATLLHFRQVAINIYGQTPASEEDAKRRNKLLECHRAWYRAFKALNTSLKLTQQFSPTDRVAFSSMETVYWGSYIFMNCAEDTQQMSFDTYLPEFKTLLHHARIALEPTTKLQTDSPSRAAAANFTFEIALIPALQFTATRCRCPTTRREAVRILSLNPPREGLWDAEQHAAVSKRVIEMEELEVDDKGWPVERTRVWSATIDANMDRNGGFWVVFCPARWIGCLDQDGKQRVIRERLTLGEPDTDTPIGQPDPLRILFQPNTAPLR